MVSNNNQKVKTTCWCKTVLVDQKDKPNQSPYCVWKDSNKRKLDLSVTQTTSTSNNSTITHDGLKNIPLSPSRKLIKLQPPKITHTELVGLAKPRLDKILDFVA